MSPKRLFCQQQRSDTKSNTGPLDEEYGIATTHSALKHMLSFNINHETSVLFSFLNNLVPVFQSDPIRDLVKEWPVDTPTLKKKKSQHPNNSFYLHVATQSGHNYKIQVQSHRKLPTFERPKVTMPKFNTISRPTIAIQILDFAQNNSTTTEGIKLSPKFRQYIKSYRLTTQNNTTATTTIKLKDL